MAAAAPGPGGNASVRRGGSVRSDEKVVDGTTPLRRAAVIGCGFLGKRIALELALQGVNVRVYDRGTPPANVRTEITQELKSEYQIPPPLLSHYFPVRRYDLRSLISDMRACPLSFP